MTQLGVINSHLVARLLPSYYALHRSPLFCHSHLEALSATLVALRMAVLFLAPAMPKLLRALERDQAAKPLHPTSIWKHLALHPACCQLLTDLLKSCSKRSSQRTVSCNKTTCWVDSDRRSYNSKLASNNCIIGAVFTMCTMLLCAQYFANYKLQYFSANL